MRAYTEPITYCCSILFRQRQTGSVLKILLTSHQCSEVLAQQDVIAVVGPGSWTLKTWCNRFLFMVSTELHRAVHTCTNSTRHCWQFIVSLKGHTFSFHGVNWTSQSCAYLHKLHRHRLQSIRRSQADSTDGVQYRLYRHKTTGSPCLPIYMRSCAWR